MLAGGCPHTLDSPIGIIPKSDREVRLILHCGRPKDFSVNDYITDFQKHECQSMDDAFKPSTVSHG